MKKYKLTNESLIFEGRTLYRIKALRDIPSWGVKAGDLGGYVQHEYNLDQSGDCWIFDNAKAMDNSQVTGNSRMYGNSYMCENSRMYDYSLMRDNSSMRNNSSMRGNSSMCDNSRMCENSGMYGDSVMRDYSCMCENSSLIKNGMLQGETYLIKDLVVDGLITNFLFMNWECFLVKNKQGELVLKAGCKVLPLSKKAIREALIKHGIEDKETIKIGLDLVQSYIKLFNLNTK
ncbi:MAG: hypothetical protein KDB74_07080 [Flavobacteriales bacterium]|nr:hypothetical protein [Flavobacteriales bacterium]